MNEALAVPIVLALGFTGGVAGGMAILAIVLGGLRLFRGGPK